MFKITEDCVKLGWLRNCVTHFCKKRNISRTFWETKE